MIHPDHLLPRLSSRQFAEWVAYFNLYPFGQDISDYQLAQMTCEMSNRWRGKGEESHKPEEFLPLFRKPKQSPEEMQQTLRRILGNANGRS